MTWALVPLRSNVCYANASAGPGNKKSRRGTDHSRIRWRLGWHGGLSRYSPVALCHRLSTALLWAAQIAVRRFNLKSRTRLVCCTSSLQIRRPEARVGHETRLLNQRLIRDCGITCSDGRGGIRTHGTLLTYTHFPGVRLKPLGHPSQHLIQARTSGITREAERTGRDSNSRYRVHRYAGFRDRCLQPLGHLSCSLATYRATDPSSTLWRLKNPSRSAAHSSARTPALTSGR